MPFEQVKSGKADPSGNGRVYAGTVTLASGTATIDYVNDLPGSPTFSEEPVIVVSSKTSNRAYPSSSGSSQATITGTASDSVNVFIHEQGGQ